MAVEGIAGELPRPMQLLMPPCQPMCSAHVQRRVLQGRSRRRGRSLARPPLVEHCPAPSTAAAAGTPAPTLLPLCMAAARVSGCPWASCAPPAASQALHSGLLAVTAAVAEPMAAVTAAAAVAERRQAAALYQAFHRCCSRPQMAGLQHSEAAPRAGEVLRPTPQRSSLWDAAAPLALQQQHHSKC